MSSKRISFKGNYGEVISCALEVHSTLGAGLLENIYGEAWGHEFSLRGIVWEGQGEINLGYQGKEIGRHRVDFLVENEVVVELRAVEAMNRIYEAQLLTY